MTDTLRRRAHQAAQEAMTRQTGRRGFYLQAAPAVDAALEVVMAENERLRAALTEIEHYSNSLWGWAAPYGDSVFLKVTRPGQLARKALAE